MRKVVAWIIVITLLISIVGVSVSIIFQSSSNQTSLTTGTNE